MGVGERIEWKCGKEKKRGEGISMAREGGGRGRRARTNKGCGESNPAEAAVPAQAVFGVKTPVSILLQRALGRFTRTRCTW